MTLDDVFAAEFETHLDQLDFVFSCLSSQGLKLKPNKCKLLQSSVHYLSHVVSEAGIAPGPEKVSAVNSALLGHVAPQQWSMHQMRHHLPKGLE